MFNAVLCLRLVQSLPTPLLDWTRCNQIQISSLIYSQQQKWLEEGKEQLRRRHWRNSDFWSERERWIASGVQEFIKRARFMNAIAADDRPTAAVTDHHRSTDHCDRERERERERERGRERERERGLECFWEESLIHNAKQEEEEGRKLKGWPNMEAVRFRGVGIRLGNSWKTMV